jgi:hypothetical protein
MTPSARNVSAPTLLAQCAISQHIAGAAASAEKYSGQLPAGQQWLHGGRIILTEVGGGQFTGWYEGHLAGVVVQGDLPADRVPYWWRRPGACALTARAMRGSL